MPSKSPRQAIHSPASKVSPGSDKANTDNATAACAEWLARYDEHENLTKRWQKLESHLISEKDWFQLSDHERRALPEATQLQTMSDRLDELYALNQRLLVTLPTTAATTTYGLAHKLSVALALVHPEENEEAHVLIQSVLRDVETAALTIKE